MRCEQVGWLRAGRRGLWGAMAGRLSEYEVFRPLMLLVLSSLVLLLLILLAGGRWSTVPLDALSKEGSEASCQSCNTSTLNSSSSVTPNEITEPPKHATEPPPKDKFLEGLLTTAFDEASCLSRYQSALYWTVTDRIPSPYLLERLRRYEEQHKKCGPNTELYKKATEQLRTNGSAEPSECNYVVWKAEAGLGNRIIALVSSFLYALLNERVLLLSVPDDMHDLLCEPFPETSWVLPSDFPVENHNGFRLEAPQSYGNLLRNKVLSLDMDASTAALPPYVYLHLMHDYRDEDKLFYCEEGQNLVKRVPWLLLRSNLYFAPGFFLLSQYDDELNRLFPEKDVVFHFLARYLLHPSNTVWGYITRYHDTYLANAKDRLGIQIRNLPFAAATFEDRLSLVINCTLGEGLLPAINAGEPAVRNTTGEKPKAVLVVSLEAKYYDRIKDMYYEHSTASGELVAVYQPSHEELQRTEQRNHNIKAMADIYLLSFNDGLVTSEMSTFGYVAQGLGGLKPWIIQRNFGKNEPACRRALSMEPCFMNPPSYDCKTKKHVDKGAIVPHVKHCEDLGWGIKLFD